jgi:DNA helicase-2/ATP-dependent DNA helicase PcrA
MIRESELATIREEQALLERVKDALRAAKHGPVPDARAPYLAHLQVDEGQGARDYLLGRATFLDPTREVRIVDWRVAPVAQLFHRYREGDAYEEALPGRIAEGTVLARRLLIFQDGVLARIVGDGASLALGPDGEWVSLPRAALRLASGGAGTAARPGVANLTVSLDAEQAKVVDAPAAQPLLVLGSAGSGKTTVALHRLARIAATEAAQHPLAEMQVVVPEEGLARLSRRLLDPLGAGATDVKTLDAWSTDLAERVFRRGIALCLDPPAHVSALKRHPALYHALRARFDGLLEKSTTLERLRRRLADLFTDRGFLGGVVDDAHGELPRSAIEETVRHTMLQLADPMSKQLASVTDAARKRAIDGRPIEEGTPDELAATIDVEELPILLFLRAWRGQLAQPHVVHLVLDEAEDFSLFELFVFGRLLGSAPSVTLAGDEGQQTASSFAGWPLSLETLGVHDAATCRLAISYRCPRPVTGLAVRLLGALRPEAPARAAKEGPPIGYFAFADEAQAQLFLAGAVADLLTQEPNASVAVIARNPEGARRFHALCTDLPDARLTLRGEFTFEPGLDVTDVDNAKGLEFDYVIVPDASADAYPATDDARRRLHVAVTRTSHRLWIACGGRPTPLVPELLDAKL